jgi:indolepyruvate decarboxylase
MAARTQSRATTTVADYILDRLAGAGVEHVFTLPATSNAGFLRAIQRHKKVDNVPTCSELEAGHAADAYARLRGRSAACVSYGVGTLSLLNAVAGSFVERVPVVVVNGGPSVRETWVERNRGVLFSHSTGLPDSDLETFRRFTAATVRVDDPERIRLVDEALRAGERQSLPAYIEVPNDLWDAQCRAPTDDEPAADSQPPDHDRVEGLADRVAAALKSADRPVVLAGVELARLRLVDAFEDFIAASKLDFVTTLLGKSLLPEDHPQFAGVYGSDLAPGQTERRLEQSDRILAIGTILGVDHASLVEARYDAMILATSRAFRFGYREGPAVPLRPLLEALTDRFGGKPKPPPSSSRRGRRKPGPYRDRRQTGEPADRGASPITFESFFDQIDAFIDSRSVVLVDTCLGSFPGADLHIAGKSRFITQAVWLSIGHLGGAVLGARCASARGARVIGITGDGGFQITPQAFSSLVRFGAPAVLFVLNNGLYGIEQYLIEDEYYRERTPPLEFCRLNRWDYARLAEAMGGTGVEVRTDPQLQSVLAELPSMQGAVLVDVHIDPYDLPPEYVSRLVQAAVPHLAP